MRDGRDVDKMHLDFYAAVVLTALFVVLKLGGAIDWGWGLVLWPVWVWSGMWLLIFLGALFVLGRGRRR